MLLSLLQRFYRGTERPGKTAMSVFGMWRNIYPNPLEAACEKPISLHVRAVQEVFVSRSESDGLAQTCFFAI